MSRQKRIINRLIEIAQIAMKDEHFEAIVSYSTKDEKTVRTWVESTSTTMLTAGVGMAVKAAIDDSIPLFVLQELIAKMYEDVLRGEECEEE